MQMIAERAVADIEVLILNGDTKSDDTDLAQLDGIRKQEAVIVDRGGGLLLPTKNNNVAGYTDQRRRES